MSTPPSPTDAEPATRTSRRWKRTHEPELEDVARGANGGSRTATPAPSFAGTPGTPVHTGPARLTARKQAGKSKLGVWIAGQAFCLGLIAVGYVVGQFGGGGTTTAATSADTSPFLAPEPGQTPLPTTGPHGVSEVAFQAVNTAMAAAKSGDRNTARQTLESAQRQDMVIPGLDYRLALLAIERTDLSEAKLRLDSAMASGQELAACCYVRAMLAGAVGDYGRASDECARAAHSEPFNARYLFFWAECLRRNGRLESAIERFEEALTRPLNQADRDYIAFKLRLAKLEANKGGDFSGELARQLKAEPPDPRWLLTAAAIALELNDAEGAAAQYDKASHLLPAATFDLYIRDYLLISHSTQKEIAPFYHRGANPATSSPNVAAITVDPVSWTLESADPAAWPSASRGP